MSYNISYFVLLILKSLSAFLNRFFHQIVGTAMGTLMAPSYANIFMGKVEIELLGKFEQESGLEVKPTLGQRDGMKT